MILGSLLSPTTSLSAAHFKEVLASEKDKTEASPYLTSRTL